MKKEIQEGRRRKGEDVWDFLGRGLPPSYDPMRRAPCAPCHERERCRGATWRSTKREDHPKCWRGCGATPTLPQCWWERRMLQPREERAGRFLTKLSILSPYHPVIGTYTKELRTLSTQQSAPGCLQQPYSSSPTLGSSQDVLQGTDKSTGASRQRNAGIPRSLKGGRSDENLWKPKWRKAMKQLPLISMEKI